MDKRSTRMEFSDRVQVARREAGLSIEELSVRSGLVHRTLRRRLEGAPGRFTIDELDAIAEATGVPLSFLLSGIRDARAVAS